MTNTISIDDYNNMRDRAKKEAQRVKKAHELIWRNCKWKHRDGHTFSCGYAGSPVAACNANARKNGCPLTMLLEDV